MQRDYDFVFKISFVGEVKVGKTSLINRYADDTFDDNVQPTLGVDFRFK
jgi:Ras-related protein Rab-18